LLRLGLDLGLPRGLSLRLGLRPCLCVHGGGPALGFGLSRRLLRLDPGLAGRLSLSLGLRLGGGRSLLSQDLRLTRLSGGGLLLGLGLGSLRLSATLLRFGLTGRDHVAALLGLGGGLGLSLGLRHCGLLLGLSRRLLLSLSRRLSAGLGG
jgi:hypothetical protein